MNEFDKPLILNFSEKSVDYNVYDSFWIPCSAKFIALGSTTTTNGVIEIYEISGSKIELLKQKIFDKQAIKCGTFGASSLKCRHLATGDFLGNLNIWDLENSFNPIYSVQGHDEIINSIDGIAGHSVGHGAPEIVTGSKDGYVKVWDPRQKGKPVAIMESLDEVKRECWAVAFGNSYNSLERTVCAGYDNGDIKMFDLRVMNLRWETTFPNGVCYLEFDTKLEKMDRLLVTALESTIGVIETRNQFDEFPTIIQKAHNSTVWCGKHLPQKKDIFITCGGSGSLCLWKYNNDSHFINNDRTDSVSLLRNSVVSSQSVTSFDWCPDKIGLAICSSFDQILRLLYITQLHLQ